MQFKTYLLSNTNNNPVRNFPLDNHLTSLLRRSFVKSSPVSTHSYLRSLLFSACDFIYT